jgi:hypothetical protein
MDKLAARLSQLLIVEQKTIDVTPGQGRKTTKVDR